MNQHRPGLRPSLGLLLLLLGGCGGAPSPSTPTPAPEAEPEVTPEAAPAPEAAPGDEIAAASEIDGGPTEVEEAASADAVTPSAADAVTPTAAAEATPSAAKDAPAPRGETEDAAYSVGAMGSARTRGGGGTLTVLVRSSPEIAAALKWTVTAGAAKVSAPTMEAQNDEFIFTWTVSGLGDGLVAGKVAGKLGAQSQGFDFAFPAIVQASPPPE